MRHFLFIIISVFYLFGTLNAQTINELKKRQREAKKQIELTNKLLKENQSKQSSTVSNLTVLQKQIAEQEKLIKSLDNELSLLDKRLNSLGKEKGNLETQLRSLRSDYAEMVYHAYFNKNTYNKYMFLLSAESINEAYHRIRYMQDYANYQKEQSVKIQAVVDDITRKEAQMMQTINEKDHVRAGKELEADQLEISKETQQSMLTDLTKKEKRLRDDLQTQQKRANEINNKIQDLIAKEIAEAERKAKERQKREAEEAARAAAAARAKQQASGKPAPKTETVTPTPVQSTLTKEETLIAGGFQKNVGRLPWPARGVITGHFGIQPHPVLQHVEVNNKGIYIQAEPGTEASAVYEGEVTQIFTIPGSNNAVIVKHGNYRTVYGNLTNTYVKVGDKVAAKQKLGKIYVDNDSDDKTELYFMLYKNAAVENPEKWLVK